MLIRREDLYEKVWRIPLQRLAKNYGISDVGLKKICKKLHIPTPGRGYWARTKHAINITHPPLPKLKHGAPDCHTITTHNPSSNKKSTSHLPPEASLLVSEVITLFNSWPKERPNSQTHELITITRKALEKTSLDRYGILQDNREKSLKLRVSEASLDRSLNILNTLILFAEQLGITTKIKEDSHQTRPATFMKILGEEIPFSLFEKIRRRDHVPLKGEKTLWAPRYDYEPTGVLTLEIHTWHNQSTQKKWSDTESKGLGDHLPNFVIGAIKNAVALKQWHMEQEEQARRKEELRKNREEEVTARQLEEKRFKELEEQAANWIKAQQLREYILAVEKRAKLYVADDRPILDLEKWITWARKHADKINPLGEGLPSSIHDLNRDA